jgi:hypothetical protein
MTDQSTTTLDSPASGESIHPLTETGRDAGERAGHLVERSAEIGFQQADRGLDQAVDGIETVADSIRRVSADMETQQPQMAELASTAADQAEAVARYLRETDVRQLIGNVEDFARRQPLVFLGGAFLVGSAASRFIKAAAGPNQPQGQSERAQMRPGNGTGTSRRITSGSDWAPTPTGEGY